MAALYMHLLYCEIKFTENSSVFNIYHNLKICCNPVGYYK